MTLAQEHLGPWRKLHVPLLLFFFPRCAHPLRPWGPPTGLHTHSFPFSLVSDWALFPIPALSPVPVRTNSFFLAFRLLPSLACLAHWHPSFLNAFIFKNWSIVDLEYCVSLGCIAKWFSYTHIYILFQVHFHYSLLQDIEYSSSCNIVWPCCLFYIWYKYRAI